MANISNMKQTYDDLEKFIASYSESDDVFESIFGPIILSEKPKWWQPSTIIKEWQVNKRLKQFNLPVISDAIRLSFHYQQGQGREDAGGYIRRRWMVAFGFNRNEYENWVYRSNEP